jgi:molybdate transport repressor ModE-like protein
MKAVTKIVFTDDNGTKFFGEGPFRLLCCVEKTGSLRAAAMEMEMAYSKASKILKQAEANLGFSLTSRSTGGKDGGGSVLTPEGKRWLSQYKAYRDACIQANQALYRQHFPRIGCVIMASGMSRRFGANKLMADFHGSPMIQRALNATEGLFARRVVVTRHESVASLCREQGVEVVVHDLPHRSDTVRLGLEALGDLDACMFLPGDQPLLRRETVVMLLQSWKEEPECIVRPVYEDSEGSPVLFPAALRADLLAYTGDRGGMEVLRQSGISCDVVQAGYEWELWDIDTPADLARLETVLFGATARESNP